MSAGRVLLICAIFTGGSFSVGGCAWHYPMPVYPPFPPDHGYSAPYDPNQQYAAPVDDAALLQPPAGPPLSGS